MPVERQIVDLTKKLIRMPSTHSRPEEIRRCADWIASWLSEHRIAHTQTNQKGIPSIAVLPQEGYARVLLLAHFDVVEADDDALFDPRELNGRLYGRGAIDDKYAVATAMVLFENHLKQLRATGQDQADMDFGLLFTGDEEVGGYNGAKAALTRLTTDFTIALDGGHPDLIVTKEKGLLHLELIARGRTAHAARPWLGQNAFDILVEDYRSIGTLFQAERADHWHKTVVLSVCKVGDGSVNKVPGEARAKLDIRYTEEDDPDAIGAAIRKVVRSEVRVEAKEPVFIGGKSSYLDLLVRHSGGAAVGFEHGASDARFFSLQGIPGAVWGADGEMSQHSHDEHVVIASITRLYEGLENFFNAIGK